MKGLNTKHSTCDALDEPISLLKDVVQVFGLYELNGLLCSNDFQGHIYGFQPRQIGPIFVDDGTIGNTIRSNRPPEETSCGSFIPALEQHKNRTPARITSRYSDIKDVGVIETYLVE